jgi:hypothetical protein
MEKFNLKYVKTGAFIPICIICGLLFYFSNEYILDHWGTSFSVFAMAGGLFALINSYLWNIKPFSFLYNVPDFSGRYEGKLTYEFRNEKNELISDSLDHVKVIVQNGSDIIINSWTKKKDNTMSSKSTSIEASIIKERDGTFTLLYNYLNDGNNELGFSPHYGTEVMKLIENKKEKHLIGKYYTERLPFQTRGKLDLKYVNKNLYHEK